LEQKNKGRARVKIAVFFVLAVHGIGLMALLMQGCGQSKEPTSTTSETPESNAPPAFAEPAAPPPGSTSTPPVVAAAPAAPETAMQPAAPPAGATEYTIASGDYLEKIAKNFHVSVKAILDANPGIVPTKLKIGQKIHIPAATTAAATAPSAAASAEPAAAGGEQAYTVKSGDTLGGIAKHFGTTAKAISAANGLKTTKIVVGQKLKIPAKAAAPVTPPVAPVEPAPTTTTTTPPPTTTAPPPPPAR
jgi:LysM repeat protein